jgi:NAD(P)-dependent dehydrogenase (short-subunit alcohol dehydrogenase family)
VSVLDRFGLAGARRNRHWSVRGIGRAIAELAASTGADMVIIDILDPLAIETGVAIAAFIVDRPQP